MIKEIKKFLKDWNDRNVFGTEFDEISNNMQISYSFRPNARDEYIEKKLRERGN